MLLTVFSGIFLKICLFRQVRAMGKAGVNAVARNNILRRTMVVSALVLAGAQLWAAQGATPAQAAEEHRYPYDPVCPWGRVADGRGMLVRCLKQDEVTALIVPPTAQKAADATESKPAAAAAADVSKEPAAAKDAPGQDGKVKDTATTDAAAKPAREVIVDKVGPIVVDTGELPLAVKKLSEPKDRYLDCVNKNGGLTGDSAEVQVRFLVRERGRAEGVTVAKSKGMSAEAARCIADVVDRRYVGYPAAPIVGATLPIVLTARSK
jgi:hypothetical protein